MVGFSSLSDIGEAMGLDGTECDSRQAGCDVLSHVMASPGDRKS